MEMKTIYQILMILVVDIIVIHTYRKTVIRYFR